MRGFWYNCRMKHRMCVVGIIRNAKKEILLCKAPVGMGVYPGQWAIPGGGIEESERMEAALHREMWEEVGLEITDIRPLFFQDDVRVKHYGDGSSEEVYMIYLLFECVAVTTSVRINDEFEEYAWVKMTQLNEYDLNQPTRENFQKLGWL